MQLMGRAVNPVLARELTERLRGPRAMVVLSIYVAVVGGILVVVYRADSSSGGPFESSSVTQLAGLGQMLFESTLVVMMLLVLFLMPGLTAGTIAGERERQTLLPLQVTLLRPISIVVGKVLASLAFALLLVVATLPLLTLSYMIGGVRPIEVLQGLGVVVFTAFTVAALSVACSAWTSRVQTATVVAYGVVVLLLVATIGGFVVARQIDESRCCDTIDPPKIILAPNPLMALADVIGDDPLRASNDPFQPFDSGSDGPLSALRDLAVPDVFFDESGGGAVAVAAVEFVPGPGGPDGRQDRAGDGGLSIWWQHALIMAGLVPFCLWASARRLRTPAKTER